MNLSKLGFSSWIIFVNIVLFVLLLLQLLHVYRVNHVNYVNTERFVNVPQQVDPDAPVKDDPAIATANNNYASLLMFIKDHPDKSGRFIEDIRSKFFANDCKVKSFIDFNNIATFSNGEPFV